MADDGSIDVGRLSVKAQVALGFTIAVVMWFLTASAGYVGFQLALADLRNKQERTDERLANYKESNDKAVDEIKKQGKLNEMDIRSVEGRIILLEASEKARNTVK